MNNILSNQIPDEISKYKVIQVLGNGGFGYVVLAQDQKTQDYAAIKIIKREEVLKENRMRYLENELRLSQRFNHPNIVQVLDIIYEKDVIYIVMEYLSNGSLQLLLTKGYRFSFEEQMRISCGILQAIHYLHQQGISHRDIKPENILFDDDMNPKLIDFGLSKENSSSLRTYCGTPFFIAPEVIVSDKYDGRKADLWAYGVTMHIMATGHFPYQVKSETQLIRDIERNQLDMYIEPKGTIGFLIENTLQIDASKRLTTAQLLRFLEEQPMSQSYVGKSAQRAGKEASLPHLQTKMNYRGVIKNRLQSERTIKQFKFIVRHRSLVDI